MWMNGNLSKEGITADLEAMKRAGIAGAVILDVEVQGTVPEGPALFLGDTWKALFRHSVSEAKRLGLELVMNDGPGYYGSGGPWVKPENAIQRIFSSETQVKGPTTWNGPLARPTAAAEYRDIAVMAVPEAPVPSKQRFQIPALELKSLAWNGWKPIEQVTLPPVAYNYPVPADAVIHRGRVVILTEKMKPDGTLEWQVPEGTWTILRIGHAWNGREVGPSNPKVVGPETDKLDAAMTRFHFDQFVRRLNEIAGPDRKGALVGSHIDSWEGGGQNWTRTMPEEFKRRRGYDLLPFLPIFTGGPLGPDKKHSKAPPVVSGRVLDSPEITERFLFDFRKTISELCAENYWAEFSRLAKAEGLRFTSESYTTIGDDFEATRFVDEPTSEFWSDELFGKSPHGMNLTRKAMSSSANLNGRKIVGGEAFTSYPEERWLLHPALIKRMSDESLALGVNRFIFHRFTAQRFPEVRPGMMMGKWGMRYDSTNTWWDWSKPWHEYLSRCQSLLRQGRGAREVLVVEDEEPLGRFALYDLKGYDYDLCGAGQFLREAEVRDGRVVFPSGASYRLVVLRHRGRMSLELLAKVTSVLEKGGAVLGEPPVATPGFKDYPENDRKLREKVASLWGDKATIDAKPIGNGLLYRGLPAEAVLRSLGVPKALDSNVPLNWCQRTLPEAEIFFVANPANQPVDATITLHATGVATEFWDPESGTIQAVASEKGAAPRTTQLRLHLGTTSSGFLVVRKAPAAVARSPRETPSSPGKVVQTLTGPWNLHFQKDLGAPERYVMEQLVPLNQSTDAGVRHFSGEITYRTQWTQPEKPTGSRFVLDLGQVEVMARVRLNGKELGSLWRPPYSVDVTEAISAGENRLEIQVVNLWINRLIGDAALPEDAERDEKGTLKRWPDWLLQGNSSPTGRFTFVTSPLWTAKDALVPSGLIGPVRLFEIPRKGWLEDNAGSVTESPIHD